MDQFITQSLARRSFADRHTTAPAEFDAKGIKQKPRDRTRKARGKSFRQWVRDEYQKLPRSLLSAKLERIVHGAP